MNDYDVVVRGGTVVTASDVCRADVGIRQGRIAAVGLDLQGRETIDASGFLVMPGGVDTHCHLEQLRPGGGTDEETFLSGTTSALVGGTTTVVPFSIQFKGEGIAASLAEYHRRARTSIADYSFPPDHHRPDG